LDAHLIDKADAVARAYGMMHWGDSVDAGYTEQGRGSGLSVWTNGEYDFPHVCFLLYARTGERRFFDMMLVSARHLMDVDICHYSEDPLRMGGQIEHSAHHVSGDVIPSHEWVEGLIDCYHLTGDEQALYCATGIGENIMRILETPAFQQTGEINARETGWALRAFTALFAETGEEKWLEKCDFIVGHFIEWKNAMGGWLSPYTDHTAVRVPFMIAIAVASLMRYYRVKPDVAVKGMILDEVDALLASSLRSDGHFFYKELPSLRYKSGDAVILEALAYAYELSGDSKYLKVGISVFKYILSKEWSFDSSKKVSGDAVLYGSASRKSCAQSHEPTAVFAKALESAGMLEKALR
jgi:hypothetical protein